MASFIVHSLLSFRLNRRALALERSFLRLSRRTSFLNFDTIAASPSRFVWLKAANFEAKDKVLTSFIVTVRIQGYLEHPTKPPSRCSIRALTPHLPHCQPCLQPLNYLLSNPTPLSPTPTQRVRPREKYPEIP